MTRTISKTDPIFLLDFPSLRQTASWDCGVNAVQHVLAWYGVDAPESDIRPELRSSEKGTNRAEIIKLFQRLGFRVKAGAGVSVDSLKRTILAGFPAILLLQAWRDGPGDHGVSWKADSGDGHWVVAIGFTDRAVVFRDPASILDTFLDDEELDARWHDVDPWTGVWLSHYAIVPHGKARAYRGDVIRHME